MIKYKKRPVIVEAVQWFKNGDHPFDNCKRVTPPSGPPSFMTEGKVVRYFRRPDVPETNKCCLCGNLMHYHGWIDTLEGGHIVCPGDYIITGIGGETYPCKPNIFHKTYELAD